MGRIHSLKMPPASRPRHRRFGTVPLLTLVVLSMTVVPSCLGRSYPSLLPLLWRDPAALPHQWWRLLSPLLIQPDPWPQALSVFVLFLVVGVVSERLWTKAGWLSLYFAGGLVGEIVGYLWQPYGAGMSVAGAGLLGGLAAWMLARAPAWQARIGGWLIFLGAVVLAWRLDIHGPPILAGSLVGALMIRSQKHTFVRAG